MLAASAILAVPAPLVRAADTAPKAAARAEDGLETALAELGPAPTTDDVVRLARKAQVAEQMAAFRFVGALTTHGGAACAIGLRTMVRHAAPDVRAAALRSIAQLRLRSERDMDVVRAARSDADPSARDAAYAAVGAVGDATDVPALLDALASTDEHVVAAAFAALRDLSGARLRCRVAVWRQWWKETEAGAPERLARSLTVLATSGAPTELAEAQVVVERNAWLRLTVVQNRVDECLRSESPELRRMGYRLAASLRLADLGETLASALAMEHDDESRRVGLESAKALGVAARGPLVVR
jgi:hypothetical protein